jgi:glutamate/tyrosine decarboxylase-like PLP-dependent enzyme
VGPVTAYQWAVALAHDRLDQIADYTVSIVLLRKGGARLADFYPAGRNCWAIESLLDHPQYAKRRPDVEAIRRLRVLDEPLPERPTDPESVLQLLDEVASPAAVASAGGRFFGFVAGGTLLVALAASWLVGAWDQNAGMVALSPAGEAIRRTSARWLLELLGLPAECQVSFVTGTTMANVTGLAAARCQRS